MKKISLLIICCLSFLCLSAQTHVSGGIYSNTTWLKANSPYIVDSNLVVFPGVSLIVQAGVTVKFNKGVIVEMRQSTLTLVGNANDPIVFTSNATTPQIGDWYGIYLHGGSLGPSVKYLNVSYTNRGFYRDQLENPYQITDVTNSTFRFNTHLGKEFKNVTFSLFENNDVGLYQPQYTENCTFNGNVYGIMDAKGLTRNCTFNANQSGIMGSEGTTKKCVFRGNANGISSISKGLNYPVIDSCTFKKNDAGIRRANSATITHNLIDSNQVGLMSYGLCKIENNSIRFNGTGISEAPEPNIGWKGANTISQNAISSNSLALVIYAHDDVISCNLICNNSGYSLKYTGSNNTVLPFARKNSWCVSDSSTLASMIYDGYDNISLGLVNFAPLDATGCYVYVGMAENASVQNISVYPNPSSGQFTINFPLQKNVVMRLFDLHGKIVYAASFANSSEFSFSLDAAPGVYLCEITGEAYSSHKKIVLKE